MLKASKEIVVEKGGSLLVVQHLVHEYNLGETCEKMKTKIFREEEKRGQNSNVRMEGRTVNGGGLDFLAIGQLMGYAWNPLEYTKYAEK